MKFFFVGDFENNTGPGMANKMMRKGLRNSSDMLYSDSKHKLTRVLELIYKTIISDIICFCSPSKANIIGILIAKLFRKKTFYIMHGYLTFETRINNTFQDEKEINSIHKYEKFILMNVEKVFCVSKKFMEFMKNKEEGITEKFDFNNNGIDLLEIENKVQEYKKLKKHNQIVSIGGGMRQKNNLTVCRAIEKLNKEENMDLTFIVIGLPYTDKESICSYEFVTYYDYLPHKYILEILAESNLYIQNSIFETFGLAVIEALASNCNLLISDNVGASGVIETIMEDEIIFNTWDIEEISGKIKWILMNANVDRLRSGLLREEIEFDKTSNLLIQKISEYAGEER
jgi:glycosyltransferase involved in cell wall biosynthesis